MEIIFLMICRSKRMWSYIFFFNFFFLFNSSRWSNTRTKWF